MTFKKGHGKPPLSPFVARLKDGILKKLFLKILQCSHKNTCAGGFRPAIL